MFIERLFNEIMKMEKKLNSRQIQAEERRLQILDTALKVFAAKGFKSASIKDIAEVAGISQGLIYHYFKDKEDLMSVTIKHHSFICELQQILTAREDLPARQVMTEIAEKFLDTLNAKSQLVKILIRDVAFDPEFSGGWSAILNEGVGLLKKYIDGRISRGEFRSHNSAVTARSMLYSVVMFHITGDIFKSSSITRKEYIRGLLDNLLTGIEAR
jgi:AcrR family transcriptional regulator